MTRSSSLSKAEIVSIATAGLCAAVVAAGMIGYFANPIWLGFAGMVLALAGLHQIRSARYVIRRVLAAAAAASAGDLEPRLLNVRDGGEIRLLADEVNHLLDLTDAFVREAKASLAGVRDGKFYRRIIERGMRGTFKAGSAIMNDAV